MLFKRLLVALALLFPSALAFAQGTQFPAGTVWGNNTAATRQGQVSSVSALLDRALGSTRGAILERGASGWAIVGPSATAGLAWISNGAGADPTYGVVSLSGGGCNAALTASNGGILYSTASACSILAGTVTARQMLQSGASAAPAWSTATWPATSAAGTILASLSANTITASSNPVLGIAGSVVGSVEFANATSGTVKIQPVTGALGTSVMSLPAATGTIANIVASGTSALGTSAIASAACATVVTTSATNTLTTDVVTAGFNGDPTGVTGYIPLTSGMLTIIAYPTANNVNFKVCNNTAGSITPGAITLNWRVIR